LIKIQYIKACKLLNNFNFILKLYLKHIAIKLVTHKKGDIMKKLFVGVLLTLGVSSFACDCCHCTKFVDGGTYSVDKHPEVLCLPDATVIEVVKPCPCVVVPACPAPKPAPKPAPCWVPNPCN
jgi:hypothetical protein